MARHGAVFGGEHSAHYYFRDFWFADTGMLAALHVLAALGEQAGALSELTAEFEPLRRVGGDQHTVDRPGRRGRPVRDWANERDCGTDELDGLTVTCPQDDAPVVVQRARVTTPSRCSGSTSRQPTVRR